MMKEDIIIQRFNSVSRSYLLIQRGIFLLHREEEEEGKMIESDESRPGMRSRETFSHSHLKRKLKAISIIQ